MASVDDYEELIATRKLNGLNDNLYKENNIEEDISILEERIFNYELSIKIGSKDKMISTSIKENEAIKHLLEERKQDKKRIKELEEYIFIAPDLDEMTAIKYANIQREGYIRGRSDEQQRAEQIIYENYIPVQKVKDVLQNNRNEIFSTTYLNEEQFKPYTMQIDRINKIEKELLEEK